jgi:hypothetical protein
MEEYSKGVGRTCNPESGEARVVYIYDVKLEQTKAQPVSCKNPS